MLVYPGEKQVMPFSHATCASLPIDRWRHLTGRSHAIPRRGWLRRAVLMKGCTHVEGHDSRSGGALRGTQGAVLATPWCRRVRNDGVERSSGTTSWCRNQTRLLLLLLLRRMLRRGSVVRLLSIVGSWSGVGWMLLLEWLLVVLGV